IPRRLTSGLNSALRGLSSVMGKQSVGNRKRIHRERPESTNNKGGAVSYTAQSEGSAKCATEPATQQLVLGLVDQLVLLDPRHHVAQLAADRFDRMHGIQTTASRHARVVGATFKDEHLGVFAGLDALQGIAHGFTGLGVDDFRTGHVLAVLGVVRDRVVHVGDAAFVHQVDNQLQFVQALEISHFRRVTSFGQGFEAHLDQLDGTAAEHGLFAEQVGFGFFAEVGFDDATLGAAVSSGVGQGDILGLAGNVLVNRDQGRHAATFQVLGTNGVAGTLRSDHDHVEVGARHDLVVMHIETVGKSQRGALLDVRLNVVLVDFGNVFVRQKDHDEVSGGNGILDFGNIATSPFGLGPGGTALAQANRDVDAGVAQVLRMGMALGTVTNDGDLIALDQGEVGVLVVINFHEILFIYR